MAVYKVFFWESVEKDFRVIPIKGIKRILERIAKLSADPRPPDCEKLTGQERYRLRQGQYRILYTIQDSEPAVWIIKISHRKDIYRLS